MYERDSLALCASPLEESLVESMDDLVDRRVVNEERHHGGVGDLNGEKERRSSVVRDGFLKRGGVLASELQLRNFYELYIFMQRHYLGVYYIYYKCKLKKIPII